MSRAARVCPVVGCPIIVRGSSRYCAEHEKEKRREVDKKRPPSSQRGYDAEWRKIRAQHLKEAPLCVMCGNWATEHKFFMYRIV
jgi:5-methylcytosine-specific restriction enzyme A